MLDPGVRKTVDQLWDLIWSSGVTNPLAVVDYLTGLFILSRAPTPKGRRPALAAVEGAAAAGDAARCVALMTDAMGSLGLSTPDPSLWRDAALLARSAALAGRIAHGDRDLLGDCFEHVLRRLSTAGHFGQFRTPRHVVRFLVEAVDPRAGESVLDPACGTAGFLIAAHEHRRGRGGGGRYLGDECDWTMARIAAANVILHGITGAEIRRRDALSDATPEADLILANPPFSGSVDPARRRALGSGAARSEVLFVELMLRRLRPGGRAGVVVPAGLLTSPARSAVRVREALVRRHGLRAVIELPAGVFRPYTDVRSALLLWRSDGGVGEVLMARVRSDGYSLDDRREPVGESDLDALLPHVLGGAAPGALRPELARRVPRDALGEAFALSPGRHLRGVAPARAPERPMQAVLADAAASAERLGRLLASIGERAR